MTCYGPMRNLQFSFTGKGSLEDNQELLSNVFAWLSNETNGPWKWSEQWINNHRSLALSLHIERKNDQLPFNEVWGEYFEYREDSDTDLLKLAWGYGVTATEESIISWKNRFSGIDEIENPERPGTGLLVFRRPELKQKFIKGWGGIKDRNGIDIVVPGPLKHSFLHPYNRIHDPEANAQISEWLTANKLIRYERELDKSDRDESGRVIRRYRTEYVMPVGEAALAAFVRDWSDQFKHCMSRLAELLVSEILATRFL